MPETLKATTVRYIRSLLKHLLRFMLSMIGPRLTIWSIYCIFAEVENDAEHSGAELQRAAWYKVCRNLSEASNICTELEVSEGWGLYGDPVVVDEGGQNSRSGDFVITMQETTCSSWVKTTKLFPLL